jgi:hypothetical protein
MVPHVGEIVRCLESSYAARGDRQLRRKAVRFAADYDADRAVQRHWKKILGSRALEAVA